MSVNNWPTKKLGELCEIKIGKTPRRGVTKYWLDGTLPWAAISDINGKEVEKTKEKISEVAVKDLRCNPIPKGTVLYTFKLSIGRVGIASTGLFTNEAIAALPVKDHKIINEKWLFYILPTIDYRPFLSNAVKGNTLNKDSLQILPIPLPTLKIQKQIVEKLDKITEAQKSNDELIKKSDELFQSLLDKELNPDGKVWEVKKLGEICDVRDGTHESPKFYPSGIPLVTSKNLSGEDVDFKNTNCISLENHKEIDKRSRVDNGDILFGMIGTIGNPVVVKKDREFSIKNVGLIKSIASDPINYFVYYSLLGNYIQKQIKKFSRGGTQKFVSLGNLRNLKIHLPPLKTQKQIVGKLSAVQEYKKQLLEQKSKLKELFDSVLHQSIEGKHGQ